MRYRYTVLIHVLGADKITWAFVYIWNSTTSTNAVGRAGHERVRMAALRWLRAKTAVRRAARMDSW